MKAGDSHFTPQKYNGLAGKSVWGASEVTVTYSPSFARTRSRSCCTYLLAIIASGSAGSRASRARCTSSCVPARRRSRNSSKRAFCLTTSFNDCVAIMAPLSRNLRRHATFSSLPPDRQRALPAGGVGRGLDDQDHLIGQRAVVRRTHLGEHDEVVILGLERLAGAER